MNYLKVIVNQGVHPLGWTHLDRLILMALITDIPPNVLVSYFKGIRNVSYSDKSLLENYYSFVYARELDAEAHNLFNIFQVKLRDVIRIEQSVVNGMALSRYKQLMENIINMSTADKLIIIEMMTEGEINWTQDFTITVEQFSFVEEDEVAYEVALNPNYEDIANGEYYFSISYNKWIRTHSEFFFTDNGFKDYGHVYHTQVALIRRLYVILANDVRSPLFNEMFNTTANLLKKVSATVFDKGPATLGTMGILSIPVKFEMKPTKVSDQTWLRKMFIITKNQLINDNTNIKTLA